MFTIFQWQKTWNPFLILVQIKLRTPKTFSKSKRKFTILKQKIKKEIYHLERPFQHWDHRWRKFRNMHSASDQLPIFLPLNRQSREVGFHLWHLEVEIKKILNSLLYIHSLRIWPILFHSKKIRWKIQSSFQILNTKSGLNVVELQVKTWRE